jgi:hypothetical protein
MVRKMVRGSPGYAAFCAFGLSATKNWAAAIASQNLHCFPQINEVFKAGMPITTQRRVYSLAAYLFCTACFAFCFACRTASSPPGPITSKNFLQPERGTMIPFSIQ